MFSDQKYGLGKNERMNFSEALHSGHCQQAHELKYIQIFGQERSLLPYLYRLKIKVQIPKFSNR